MAGVPTHGFIFIYLFIIFCYIFFTVSALNAAFWGLFLNFRLKLEDWDLGVIKRPTRSLMQIGLRSQSSKEGSVCAKGENEERRAKSEPSPPKCGGLLDCSADLHTGNKVSITEAQDPKAVGLTYSILDMCLKALRSSHLLLLSG
jgi:hypothetical protein